MEKIKDKVRKLSKAGKAPKFRTMSLSYSANKQLSLQVPPVDASTSASKTRSKSWSGLSLVEVEAINSIMTKTQTSPLTSEAAEDGPREVGPQEVVHEVGSNETLLSIAARYDVTPSQLAQFNRLNSRYVFPGQRLRIPPPEPEEKQAEEEPEMYDDPQFIRLNVRHLTEDHGTVAGALLMTPKVIMFNPSIHDPLVAEDEAGTDRFQVITPTDLVVNVALLKEFVRFDTTELEPERDPGNVVCQNIESFEGVEPDEGQDPGGGSGGSSGGGPMMYLRVVMGKPINQRLPRSAPVMSYGEQKLEPQYWFVMPPFKAKLVFEFIHRALLPEAEAEAASTPGPTRYGLVDPDRMAWDGYEFIQKGTVLIEAEVGRTCNRETVAQAKTTFRRAPTMNLADLPDMVGGVSDLVDCVEDRLELARAMPPRTAGHDWVLAFKTSQDGFNLNTLTRRIADVEGPVLLLIEDLKGYRFGAFLSGAPKCSLVDRFDGTGETFVFTLRPSVKFYTWTGENQYFYKVDKDCLIVGSGGGNFALWLDADLDTGRTNNCSTFDSEPLTPTKDFTVKSLECWYFQYGC